MIAEEGTGMAGRAAGAFEYLSAVFSSCSIGVNAGAGRNNGVLPGGHGIVLFPKSMSTRACQGAIRRNDSSFRIGGRQHNVVQSRATLLSIHCRQKCGRALRAGRIETVT